MGGSDLFAGTLDLLILRTLEREPMHAYGVGRILRETSQGVLEVAEGVLYPALHRLEARGWVTGEWRKSESGRRARYYALTTHGRRARAEAVREWTAKRTAVESVLALPGEGA